MPNAAVASKDNREPAHQAPACADGVNGSAEGRTGHVGFRCYHRAAGFDYGALARVQPPLRRPIGRGGCDVVECRSFRGPRKLLDDVLAQADPRVPGWDDWAAARRDQLDVLAMAGFGGGRFSADAAGTIVSIESAADAMTIAFAIDPRVR